MSYYNQSDRGLYAMNMSIHDLVADSKLQKKHEMQMWDSSGISPDEVIAKRLNSYRDSKLIITSYPFQESDISIGAATRVRQQQEGMWSGYQSEVGAGVDEATESNEPSMVDHTHYGEYDSVIEDTHDQSSLEPPSETTVNSDTYTKATLSNDIQRRHVPGLVSPFDVVNKKYKNKTRNLASSAYGMRK